MISSSIDCSSDTVVAPIFSKTQQWFQERAVIPGGVCERHKGQIGKLVACFVELRMSDAKALAFCKKNVDQRLFWLEWDMCAESGMAEFHHKKRCKFISNLRAGRPTIMMNIPRSTI